MSDKDDSVYLVDVRYDDLEKKKQLILKFNNGNEISREIIKGNIGITIQLEKNNLEGDGFLVEPKIMTEQERISKKDILIISGGIFDEYTFSIRNYIKVKEINLQNSYALTFGFQFLEK